MATLGISSQAVKKLKSMSKERLDEGIPNHTMGGIAAELIFQEYDRLQAIKNQKTEG